MGLILKGAHPKGPPTIFHMTFGLHGFQVFQVCALITRVGPHMEQKEPRLPQAKNTS